VELIDLLGDELLQHDDEPHAHRRELGLLREEAVGLLAAEESPRPPQTEDNDLGFVRIVASETEAPNILAILV
jgi:hypothetical protein